MKLLIATPLSPLDIGGPTIYSQNLKESFEKRGYQVAVCAYGREKILPSGLRHLLFFGKLIPKLFGSKVIIALDTFSVAGPTILAKFIFRKKVIIRIGGDFLWEEYVERTGQLVKLADFYKGNFRFSFKEKLIFTLTKFILKHSDALIFNTVWQKNIWQEPYDLRSKNIFIISNYYGPKEKGILPERKNFIHSTRSRKLKNSQLLKEVFASVALVDKNFILDDGQYTHAELLEKIKSAYALILPSISDVSPNFILEGIRYNKPFILTRETGLYEQLKDIGLFIDPFNQDDIKNKILLLGNDQEYKKYQQKVSQFTYVQTWHEIANQFLTIIEDKI